MDQQAVRPLNPLLRMAVLAGVETAVRLHIKRGDDLNARDGGGLTPLMLAASKNKGAICALLIESGADPSLTDLIGRDALAVAVAAGAVDAIAVLEPLRLQIDSGISVPFYSNSDNVVQGDTAENLGIVEVGDDEFDLSGWEAVEDAPPPTGDATLVDLAISAHRIISAHSPIDDAEDWGEFEAFLPAFAVPLAKAVGEEGLKGIRRLMLRALREGSVPELDVVNLGANDDGTRNEESEALLRMVLGEIGAETDERLETEDSYSWLEEGEAEEEAISEALEFLNDVSSGRSEPMYLYVRDMRGRRLLTADEEVSLGRQMEEGAELALDALASWPEGVAALLDVVNRVGDGEISAETVLDGGADESTEESGVAEPVIIESEDAEDADEDGISLSQVDQEFRARVATVNALARHAGSGGGGERALRDALAAARLGRPFLVRLASSVGHGGGNIAMQFRSAVARYSEARERMIVSNLRLCISVVKRYRGLGLTFDDLVQVGNIGLMKAVDRFDWRRGFRFSTYATWWIRQNALRAVADTGRTIRMPVHVHELLPGISRQIAEMERIEGRAPSLRALSERLGMPEKKLALLMPRVDEPVSLYDSDENGNALVDMLVDDSAEDPAASSEQFALAAIFQKMLADLEPRAAEIVKLRFGLDGGEPYTLAEAGEHFGFTRERARQIEAGALKKLSTPSRAEILCEFLEGYSAGRHCPGAEVQVDAVEPDVEARPKRGRPRNQKKYAEESVAKSNECSNDGSVDKSGDDATEKVLSIARSGGAEVNDGRERGGKIVVRLRWNGPQTRLLIRALLENGFKPYPGMEYRK